MRCSEHAGMGLWLIYRGVAKELPLGGTLTADDRGRGVERRSLNLLAIFEQTANNARIENVYADVYAGIWKK